MYDRGTPGSPVGSNRAPAWQRYRAVPRFAPRSWPPHLDHLAAQRSMKASGGIADSGLLPSSPWLAEGPCGVAGDRSPRSLPGVHAENVRISVPATVVPRMNALPGRPRASGASIFRVCTRRPDLPRCGCWCLTTRCRKVHDGGMTTSSINLLDSLAGAGDRLAPSRRRRLLGELQGPDSSAHRVRPGVLPRLV